MIVSRVARQIPDLSAVIRKVSIVFPSRAAWTPVVPDAPVIETEVDKFRSGTLSSVLPLGLWQPQGPADDVSVARAARQIYTPRQMDDIEMEHIDLGGAY